jgi:hypothetical protein
MSPRPPRPEPVSIPTSLEILETLAKESESEPLRTLAGELLALRDVLADPGQAPDLEGLIDRAVAQVLMRTGRDDKGVHYVGSREIDSAVKWYAVKHKVAATSDPEPEGGELGGALGRGQED